MRKPTQEKKVKQNNILKIILIFCSLVLFVHCLDSLYIKKVDHHLPLYTSHIINHADTAWLMMSTTLIIMMTIPALALFYGGLVRRKNMLSVLMQCLVIFSMITLLWIVYGYSIAFTQGNRFFGGLSELFLSGITPFSSIETFTKGTFVSAYAYIAFQSAFAAISVCLIVGSLVERIKFPAILMFSILWFTFSYLPIAHMVWFWLGPSAYTTPNIGQQSHLLAGYFFQEGVLDFAGGMVVHINAATAGLVGAYLIGKRSGYGKGFFKPHNLTLTMVGASLLWVGWFGFNAGSTLSANNISALALVNTLISTSSAVLSWVYAEWYFKGKPSMLGAASGAVSGLVAITPAAGYVNIVGSIIIGLAAGVCCLWGVNQIKRILKIDDGLDVFGVHGVGGIVGALLTGIFASPSLGGTGIYNYVQQKTMPDYSILYQVWIQFQAVVIVLFWSGSVSFICYKIVDYLIGLRVPHDIEQEGLDIHSHGETAYDEVY